MVGQGWDLTIRILRFWVVLMLPVWDQLGKPLDLGIP